MTNSKQIIVIGAGGHSKVLGDLLRRANREVAAFAEYDESKVGSTLLGRPVVSEHTIPGPSMAILVNGIGSIDKRTLELRRSVFEKYKSKGYSFLSLTDPTALIASNVELQEGSQIILGAKIQVDAKIGSNTIINTGASIDHDCVIGNNVHIAPGVICSGFVTIKDNVHIGTGAVIIQRVTIDGGSLIAAGAVVTQDVPGNSTLAGVPARVIR